MLQKISIFLLIFICTLNCGYSQTQISVTYTENNGGNVDKPVYLYADASHAYFVADSIKGQLDSSISMRIGPVNGKASINFSGRKSTIYYLNRENDIVSIKNPFYSDTSLVLDSLPSWKWQIINGQNKQIGSYNCEVAKTIFRGSPISAYFTRDIPIPFGPYKFKGLPGLILMVVTDPNTYDAQGNLLQNSWVVQSVSALTQGKKVLTIPNGLLNTTSITYRDMRRLEKEKMLKMLKRMSARMDKPGETTTISDKHIRNDVEQKFEWEK